MRVAPWLTGRPDDDTNRRQPGHHKRFTLRVEYRTLQKGTEMES